MPKKFLNYEGMNLMKSKYRLLIMVLIFNSLVLVSPFMTTETVHNYDELKEVSFGFPIPFVIQDQSHYDPPFPYDMSFSSPWETSTTIDLGAFILSIFIVNFVGVFLFRLLDNR